MYICQLSQLSVGLHESSSSSFSINSIKIYQKWREKKMIFLAVTVFKRNSLSTQTKTKKVAKEWVKCDGRKHILMYFCVWHLIIMHSLVFIIVLNSMESLSRQMRDLCIKNLLILLLSTAWPLIFLNHFSSLSSEMNAAAFFLMQIDVIDCVHNLYFNLKRWAIMPNGY